MPIDGAKGLKELARRRSKKKSFKNVSLEGCAPVRLKKASRRDVRHGRGAVRRGLIFLDSTGVARETQYIILRHEEIQILSDLCTVPGLMNTEF